MFKKLKILNDFFGRWKWSSGFHNFSSWCFGRVGTPGMQLRNVRRNLFSSQTYLRYVSFLSRFKFTDICRNACKLVLTCPHYNFYPLFIKHLRRFYCLTLKIRFVAFYSSCWVISADLLKFSFIVTNNKK